MRTIFRRCEYKSDLASVARRGDPINAPATPTPKSFMLAREIDRLNAEAAQIESRADQNARGGSAEPRRSARRRFRHRADGSDPSGDRGLVRPDRGGRGYPVAHPIGARRMDGADGLIHGRLHQHGQQQASVSVSSAGKICGRFTGPPWPAGRIPKP